MIPTKSPQVKQEMRCLGADTIGQVANVLANLVISALKWMG